MDGNAATKLERALERVGHTLASAARLTDDELLRIRGVGVGGLAAVRALCTGPRSEPDDGARCATTRAKGRELWLSPWCHGARCAPTEE